MSVEGWYPVALADDLLPGTSAGVVIEGMEIVIWRDTAGAPHVWEDRCPHRGMKLSFGFVRGDHIACLYHGWEFGADGRCRTIPAHPDLEVPKTICTRLYGVAESGGMIWAGLGEAGEAPSADAATPVRSLFVDAPLDTVVAGLPAAFGATAVSGAAPLLTLTTPEGTLRIGLHRVGAGQTALHLTVAGTATPALCAQFARAATLLRDRLETGAAA